MDLTRLLYLSRSEVSNLCKETSSLFIDAVSEALIIHAQRNFVQPLKPYLRINSKDYHIADRIIAMPAHVGGNYFVSGIKWIGSKHSNPTQNNLERASGLIILNDPETNYPIAVIEASLISSMRTAAVTSIAARYLAKKSFTTIACLGCGVIAKHQIITLIEQFGSSKVIHLYDINPHVAQKLATEIKSKFTSLEFVIENTAQKAVKHAEVIVTCTTVDNPYMKFEWIEKGAFISNVSIMDLHKDVFTKADKVVVDDWDQANREKKILNQLVLEGKFSHEDIYAELGEIVAGEKVGRSKDDEIIVLNPMGMAIEDIACAKKIYDLALQKGIGKFLSLY